MSTTKEQPQEEGIVARKAPPREPIPAGNYFARCFSMILIGTIDEDFNGKVNHLKKVRLSFEIPEIMRVWKEGDEPKPATIDNEYTVSLSPKANLRKDIDAWRGKGLTEKQADAFDITVLLGKGCMLNIIHKQGEGKNTGKVYEKITSIASVPKGLPCPEQINDTVLFNYASKFNPQFVEGLPEFIRTKIKSSDEWKAKIEQGIVAQSNKPAPDEENHTSQEGQIDDLPF